MQIVDVYKDIQNKTPQPVYVFTGEEQGTQLIYSRQISEIAGGLVRVDNVAGIYNQLTANTLFGGGQGYIIRDDYDFMKNGDLKKLREAAEKGGRVIVLLYSEIKKTTSFWKNNKDDIVVFEPLLPEHVGSLVSSETGMDRKTAVKIAEVCGGDTLRAINEADKVLTLAKVYNMTPQEAFELAMTERLIYYKEEANVFDITKQIIGRDYVTLAESLEGLEDKGGNPLGLLTMLYQHYKALLALETYKTTKGIQNRTDVQYWQVRNVEPYRGMYTLKEIRAILKDIRFIEKAVKSGRMEVANAIDYLVVRSAIKYGR